MDHLVLPNMRTRDHITAPPLAASQNEFSGNFFTYPDRQSFRSTLNTYSADFFLHPVSVAGFSHGSSLASSRRDKVLALGHQSLRS